MYLCNKGPLLAEVDFFLFATLLYLLLWRNCGGCPTSLDGITLGGNKTLAAFSVK